MGLKKHTASILQVLGLAAIASGVALFNIAAGVITLGTGLVLLGVALERGDV